ncbi:MAG: Mur ligase family protein [Devosia sp.]
MKQRLAAFELMMVERWFALVAPLQGRAAARAMRKHVGTYVAVTGSVGKTTTVNLTARALAPFGSVAMGSFRNVERSVYRSLRRLTERREFVVQELSAFPLGTIDRIAKHVTIDVGVVTTIGLDHLSAFRTEEAVAAEKVKLVERVRPGGLVCLNADYPLVRAMEPAAAGRRVVLYGRAADAEVRAEHVTARWPEGLAFDLVIGDKRRRVRTRLPGTLMVENALACLSVVHGLGLDMDAAIATLVDAGPPRQRLTPVAASDGNTYFLDTMKASVWSTMLLAGDLKNWGDAHRIFVLGNLSDKGADTSRRYRQVLRLARETCDLVIGIGESSGSTQRLITALVRDRSDKKLPAVHPRVVLADTIAAARAAIAAAPRGLVIVKGAMEFPLDSIVPDPPKSVAPAADREPGL